jgi:hypothetical protein
MSTELAELAESDATDEIAEIFAEIRHFYATPYVSSIHRHLATRPGVLEWAWELVAPAFRTGIAQEAGWRIAADAALTPLPPIPPEALAVWGVARSEIGTIQAIAESFTRVSPLNLVFGGIVRDFVMGAPRGAPSSREPREWSPPVSLAPPLVMVDPARLPDAERLVLERFRSGTGSTAFVPGLYRMLAHWPGLLAHLAVELGPRFVSSEKTETARRLIAAIDDAVADIRTGLPTPKRAPPSKDECAHLVRMIDGYRVTSPEMILFGRLIREAVAA